MASGPLQAVVRLVRKASLPEREAVASSDLLRRFVAQREDAAFAAIVEEYGPMVLGVCRRILKNACDVEDAFQAAFMVLAAKAGSISRPELLGTWLYRVTFRVALRARTETAMRPERQAAVDDVAVTPPIPEVEWADLRVVLDEEIDRLPEKYRRPVVLCYLEGETNDEAARRLGCAKGTIFSRLAWARERLRSRLGRRGIALPATLVAAVLSAEILSAAVPVPLAKLTIERALSFLAPSVAGATTTIATVLARGVLRTMLFTRIRSIATVLLVLAVLGTGVGIVSTQPWASAEPQELPRGQDDPGRKDAGRQPPGGPGFGAGAGLGAGGQVAPPRGGSGGSGLGLPAVSPKLADLLKQRRDAAATVFTMSKKQLLDGMFISNDAVCQAAQRFLEAELELCSTRAERIKACEAHRDNIRELAEMSRHQLEAGKINVRDATIPEYYRLDAEIRLEREKAGQGPGAAGPGAAVR
jgi:RNA polymerase sigma factor (sigma-70 family)